MLGGHSTELVPSFLKLLRDGEAEVRVAAAGKVAAFCKLLGSETARTPQVQPQASSVFSYSCRPYNFTHFQKGSGEGRPGPLHLLNVLFKVATFEGRLGYHQS